MQVNFKVGNLAFDTVVFLNQKIEFNIDDVASIVKEIIDIEIKGGNVFIKFIDEEESLPDFKQVSVASFETRQILTLIRIDERLSETKKTFMIKDCTLLKYNRHHERINFNEPVTVFCKNEKKIQCTGSDISDGGISFLIDPIFLENGVEFVAIESSPFGKREIELKTIKYLNKDTIQLGAKFISSNKDTYGKKR